jgi:hypothetical protein
MKRILSAAVIPFLATLGACSGGSTGSPAPVKTAVTVDSGAASHGDGGGVVAMPVSDAAAANNDGGSDTTTTTTDDGSTATEYDATLSGAQVVPPVTTQAASTAQFFLQDDGVTLTYQIDLSMVEGATAVNVHVGSPGDVAPVAHALTPVGAMMTGKITLTADEATALTTNRLYVDVQTMAHSGGEIRGQITLPMATVLVAMPTGAQEVPPIVSAYAAGTHASFIVSPDQTTVTYHVVTSATPTNILIEQGIAGLNGATLVGLNLSGSSAHGTYDGNLQVNDATPYLNGEIYVNIETAGHQTGELRGQVMNPGETLFSATLSGASEVPPNASQATGAVEVFLDPAQANIRYEAVISGTVPQAISLFTGAATTTAGTPWYQLTLGASGAVGTQSLAMGDAAQFLAGNVFVDVFTPSFAANGELRGQLVKQ